jgi:hypothetical protein
MYTWTKLPLFDEWDYRYTVPLEGSSYSIRLYYSDRTEKWTMDLSQEGGDPLWLGEAISSFKAIMEGQIRGLNGFFWLEPIAQDFNQTNIHPSDLFKYFNFYYILPDQ